MFPPELSIYLPKTWQCAYLFNGVKCTSYSSILSVLISKLFWFAQQFQNLYVAEWQQPAFRKFMYYCTSETVEAMEKWKQTASRVSFALFTSPALLRFSKLFCLIFQNWMIKALFYPAFPQHPYEFWLPISCHLPFLLRRLFKTETIFILDFCSVLKIKWECSNGTADKWIDFSCPLRSETIWSKWGPFSVPMPDILNL